jgi:plasmid stabilization system protein ParE
LTEEAKNSLRLIEIYIRQKSHKAAKKTLITITRKINLQLTAFPFSTIAGKLPATRELFFSDIPYVVLYSAENDTIKIISVFHTSQNR